MNKDWVGLAFVYPHLTYQLRFVLTARDTNSVVYETSLNVQQGLDTPAANLGSRVARVRAYGDTSVGFARITEKSLIQAATP